MMDISQQGKLNVNLISNGEIFYWLEKQDARKLDLFAFEEETGSVKENGDDVIIW